MARIVINNIGPIKSIDFELKQVNLFIGPQSSGKSTIAKIISYCQWVEKRYILDGVYNEDVWEMLLDFHKLDSSCFTSKSYIKYETDIVKIEYKGSKLTQEILKYEKHLNYEKTKNIYIPSERNFVASIPNLKRYNETNDNILSFLYDWYSAKKNYSKTKPLDILDLGIKFYSDFKKDNDYIILNDANQE